MKILRTEEIRAIERATIENEGISSIELIERVAEGVADEVKSLVHATSRLLVFAGWSNNGAYALEASRLLALAGYRPFVYLFNIGGNRLSTECAIFRDRIADAPGITLFEIDGTSPFQWPEPTSSTVIIDGLFGSELDRQMPRSFKVLAQNVNESGATVISIDMPSGLFTEWNGSSPRNDMIHAAVTLAVEFPRLAFMFGDNADVVGKWKVLRIGFDPEAIRNAPYSYALVDRAMCARFLKPRPPFSSKADFGSVLLYSGQRGMMGSAVLAARGALRAGAGKVTVHGPSDGTVIVQTAVPSAMYDPDTTASHITNMVFNARYDAIGLGPGIGTADDTAAALERFVKSAAAAGRRIVLDADALNIIAKHPNILNYLTPLSVITPHNGEFDRIFGNSDSDEERLKKAIRAAEDYNLIIVLKGHRTAIVRPDGKILFNASGTPAMATPGCGDVLTGVITGLMAQGMQSEIAAFVGPYIHGVAGQLAAERHGEYGVTAEDIASMIGTAINSIIN